MINLTDLIGKPFELNGRGPEKYDCYGLCIEIFRRRGITLPEIRPVSADGHEVSGLYDLTGNLFECVEAPSAWDIVVFELRPPWAAHCGVLLPHTGRFIHVLRGCNVAIEQLCNWSQKIRGYYRYE